MRRLEITKGHRLRRADREQLRPAPARDRGRSAAFFLRLKFPNVCDFTTPEGAARRLEIIGATGCAALIASDLDTKSCKPLQPSC